MSKPKENKSTNIETVSNNSEYLKQLEGENLKLRKQGFIVNKKCVQRIAQKPGLQVSSFTRKSCKYNSYKGKVGKVSPNRVHRRFKTHILHQNITTDTSEFKYY